MSRENRISTVIGVTTILLSVFASMVGVLWYTAQIAYQIEVNSKNIEANSAKIGKLTEIIIKERK